MSEPGKTLEIEDVLSSIRRLVSQDTAVPRAAGAPHRAAAGGAEAQCLVLTPALRVESEEGAEELPAVEAAEEAPEAFDEAPFAQDVPETAEPIAEVVEFSTETPVEAAAEIEDAAEPEMSEAAIPEPEMSETEALLRAAESALAESGALLDDADAALGEAVEEEDAEAETLGDELARLESTIAEMEAAVTGSEVEFEPEEGDRFEAEGAEPLVDLPENFDAEAFAEAAVLSEPEAAPAVDDDAEAFAAEEEALSMAARFGSPAEIDEAEFVEEAPEAVAEADGDAPGEVDPDLQDASWAGQDAGMDWAEAALSLAQPKTARRLHLSDAEEPAHRPEIRRSSYDEMRAEFERDSDDDVAEAAEAPFAEPLIDEETLREMVAQMIREELRGTLGERITSNVRRLVRREIQRALMGQDFD
ncbi:MAG: hypothetical protein AB7U46_01620 [Paenirhodobacter sp.]|uniref:hypothetical protein n=1 Tax=Paenirhodobacter sp. TaxID=1965326 RepID=UPI003D151D28